MSVLSHSHYLRLLGAWLFSCFAVLSLNAQFCDYSLVLEDTGGDGWGDAFLTVETRDAQGVFVSSEIVTMPTGFFQEIPLTVIYNGGTVLIYSGSAINNEEITFRIRSFGITVGWSGYDPASGYSYVGLADCSYIPHSSDCEQALALTESMDGLVIRAMPGDVEDLGVGSQGCLDGETHGIWLTYNTLLDSSFLELTIEVAAFEGTTTPDLDFALWGPFETNPILQCGSLGQPIRCSSALTYGSTGMDMDASDLSEATQGDGWVQGVDVEAFQRYLLYIDSPSLEDVFINVDFNGLISTTTEEVPAPLGAGTGLILDYQPDMEGIVLRSMNVNDRIGTVQVFDIAGQLMRSVTSPIEGGGSAVPLDISGLPAGTYVVCGYGPSNGVLGVARFVKW